MDYMDHMQWLAITRDATFRCNYIRRTGARRGERCDRQIRFGAPMGLCDLHYVAASAYSLDERPG